MGIFGWSYPAGCNGPPDCDEGPCEVCGKNIDNCICPECPECGEVGRPECYENHGLHMSLEQTESKEIEDAKINEQLRRENEGYELMIEQQIVEEDYANE